MTLTSTTSRLQRYILRIVLLKFVFLVLALAGLSLSALSLPALSASHLMTGQVESFDGVTLSYDDAGGTLPPLVFVHGWSCNRTFWDNQTQAFAGTHRVIRIDLAGHGASGLGRTDWTIDAFGRDVAAVAAALDLQDIVLVGHSLGGPVVVKAANHMPERVAAVIGVDTFKDITESYTQAELDFFEAALSRDLNAEVRRMGEQWFARGNADAAMQADIIRQMSATDLTAAVPSALSMAGFDYAAELAVLKPPFRLINAANESRLYEPIREIKADFEVADLGAVSHFPMLEDPSGFNEALGAVLARLADR